GLERQRSKPKIPVTPVPLAPSPARDAYNAPTPPPIAPQINGFPYLKLTPKMAGSVIPIKPLSAEGSAIALTFLFFVFNATAKVAAPCPTLAADASGSQ